MIDSFQFEFLIFVYFRLIFVYWYDDNEIEIQELRSHLESDSSTVISASEGSPVMAKGLQG